MKSKDSSELTLCGLQKLAKSSKFVTFNLYLTHTNAQYFMDSKCSNFYYEYIQLPMEKRREIYNNLLNDTLVYDY